MPIFSIISMGDIMKKIMLLFIALFIFSSCSQKAAPPEPYLCYPMSVEAHLECDAGNARVIIDYEDEEHYTVRYTEPQVMTGITYGIDEDGAYMSFGESRIAVTDGEACFASLAIGRLLCPRKEDTVSVTFGEDGVPTRAEGTVDGFKAAITEIKIEYKTE